MVITVQCPDCSTSFPVDPAKVPPGGVKVRCSICATTFRVERPEEGVAAAPAPAPLPPPAPVLPEPDVEEEPWPEPEAIPEPSEADTDTAPEMETSADVETPGAAEPEEEPSGDWTFEAVEAPEVPEVPEVPEAPEAPAEPEPEEIPEPSAAEVAAPAEVDAPAAAEPEEEPSGDWTFERAEAPEGAEDAALPETPEAPEGAEPEEIPEPSSADTDIAAEVVAPAAAEPMQPPEEWVFETEEEIDAGSLEIESVGTVEESLDEAREGRSSFGDSLETGTDFMETMALPTEETPLEVEPPAEPGSGLEPEPQPEPAPAAEAPSAPSESPAQPLAGFTFGKRDPHDKARRLARVLVSDIITYNPDRHQRALAGGTLKEDFEDEIEKSWREYVDQVGDEIASGTTYWTEALNDVLAQGQQVF